MEEQILKWNAKDIERYLSEKAYIDTVLLPLVPLTWDQGMLPVVREGEYAKTIAREIERQLKGRIVLAPSFTYWKHESVQERMKRLTMWENEIKAGDAKFVFFVTSDVEWKTALGDLDTLLWLPAVPLEHMDERHRKDFIDENVGSLLKLITKKWS
ncbi:YpiF family protein [Camelliibacillus cellulosilyticus]|uniref:YpiF family protein n=1 Tax=Camelliibacillus cellulosilyticus TaxID=2174486 RepID=A0ABV9GM79_9BACL